MIISDSIHNIIIRSVVTMEKVVVFAIKKHKKLKIIKSLLFVYYKKDTGGRIRKTSDRMFY